MKLAYLTLLTAIPFFMLVSACEETSTVSIPESEQYSAQADYPINTCSDFSQPTTPTNASTQPLLIVRIRFEGDPLDSSYTGNPFAYTEFYSDACTWAKKIFYNDSEGQLNHYFNAVSDNKFHLVPAQENHENAETYQSLYDGIITVTLGGNHPNPGASGDFHQKLVEALTLADDYIDFSSFDVSNDGVIHKSDLQIMFLVAGYESATVDSSYHGVWAHQWCLYGQEGVSAPTLDGITLLSCSGNGYSRFGERHRTAGYDATIGIIAHELGHAVFSLPDLYDTDGSSSGIGNFGLMGGGSWGYESGENPGHTPIHPTAWTKTEIGWITPTLPTNGQTLTLYATEQTNYNIAKVVINSNEYFLAENRSSLGYDKGLYMLSDISSGSTFQGGIAIWHIDETVTGSTPNDNENRKKVDLEEANNPGLDNDSHSGQSTNLFWDSNNATFNDSSDPNSKSNLGVATNIEITGITDRDVEMDATFNF
ncbi:M6 family metalloprotease domain-containing protein [bacterium]|nr:M6 family metalloprotease domain-containing protein [bacterium]